MRIYLDAAPVIYFVEQHPQFAQTVGAYLSTPGTILVTTDLTRLECRTFPLRNGNTNLLQEFDQFFLQTVAEVVELSRSVMDRATEIRATYGFKTPDAIHLAAAVTSGCDAFLTNDQRLVRFTQIAIEVL